MSELPKRTRKTVAAPKLELSFLSGMSDTDDDSHEDEEEWMPEAKALPAKRQARKPKEPTKKPAAKAKTAAAPKPRKTAAKKVSKTPATDKGEFGLTSESKDCDPSEFKVIAAPSIKQERKSISVDQSIKDEKPKKRKTPQKPKSKPVKVKAERMSLGIDDFPSTSSKDTDVKVKAQRMSLGIDDFPSTSSKDTDGKVKKERRSEEEEPPDDFTFGPPTKKLKVSSDTVGKPVKYKGTSSGRDGTDMNWNFVEVVSERTNVEPWVCANLIQLFQDENTIPFIARYRKELINNLDAEAVREVQQSLEELRSVARKAHSLIEKLKKEGKLNSNLHNDMLNCRTLDEIEHVYAPFKTGSKGTKAQRARQLGLEPAAKALIETPVQLNLHTYIKNDTEGLTTLQDIEMGVQHILADMIAKDKDTLEHIRNLCKQNYVTINSTLAKTMGKEKEKEGNVKDVDKFHLYHNFTGNISRIQHHQILAINRGENLKVLTVKVTIPDRVKDAFCRWCVNERWRPKQFARPEFMTILRNSVEDSYKRLIYPLLCREYRSKLSSDAEKESIMMFGRNLRQLLLAGPVRGRTIMGVDPGYKHGCKLAIISATNQILHTDVVYLHTARGGSMNDAEKIKRLLLNFNCYTIAIGNGTACRETERYFADLIQRRFFAPLNVAYCITNEAGASIYSVSPEATKEMPDLDPNLRSAVSIARRVQDPLAELVKIEPKHIGVGMYQHDVSQVLLKGTLDSVVEECVSFVGVDINICSETLLRHIAGLNSVRAKNVIEWREKNGPFINREQLKCIKGLGPKTFQQCAGFIRINQEYVKNLGRDQSVDQNSNVSGSSAPASHTSAPKQGKKAAKSTLNIPAKPNPLDQTCIHPESYNIAARFLSIEGGSANDIGTEKIQRQINEAVQREGVDKLAEKLKTTVLTLQLIIDGLCQPEGYDIRTAFDKTDFKTNIVCIEDLKVGTVLTGKVENATLFGVFVDIGVGKAGLIPMRFITEDKLSKEKRRRSLGLGPGERVEVRVLNIDVRQSRITLELLRVLK
ncbi:PREDICTED: S1 RNA-binding domain-containing protein 1 [Nanorana parkeri]|uniref:S1 RNA-binding domain-containing protein 1 n=1 Tax=Nanorana parkeri TaxID=125878 RepID=UPI000854FEFF|nr:PREDICTED: S1 RNA-binding domain-containing protein 1 [Nanorana parkeri]